MGFFKDRKNKKEEKQDQETGLKKDKVTSSNDVELSDGVSVTAKKDQAVGFLQGNLLIATQQIQEQCFARSVIFITSHNETGAMGLIVNKELRKPSVEDVIKQLGIENTIDDKVNLPLHLGGPVDTNRGFVIHSDEYSISNTVKFPNGVAISSEKQAIEDFVIGKGAKKMCLAMGYAGWTAGQIEKELEQGAWINVPASSKLVFEISNDSKWQKAADSQGIDIYKLTPFIGNA